MDEKKMIKNLEEFFAKAPHLPAKWRETLVNVLPWLVLVFGVLGVLAGISALGVSPIAALGGVRGGAQLMLSGVALIAGSVLMLLAYSQLRVKAYKGWRLLVLGQAIYVVSQVLSFDLVGAALSFLVGFYFLFEIKSYYK